MMGMVMMMMGVMMGMGMMGMIGVMMGMMMMGMLVLSGARDGD